MENHDAPLVAVASFATPLEAHLIKGLLEAEGLQVLMADEHLVGANSALAYAVGGVKLLVRAPHRERALSILAAMRRGDYVLAPEDDSHERTVLSPDVEPGSPRADTDSDPGKDAS